MNRCLIDSAGGLAVLLAATFAPSMARAMEGQGPASRPAQSPSSIRARPMARTPVAYEDLVLLTRYARRAMEDRLTGRPERAAQYYPPALQGQRGIVHLTLRSLGRQLAEAQSQESAIVDASVAAGTLLGQALLDKKVDMAAAGFAKGLELEWLGPCEYLTIDPFEAGGTWSEALIDSFEPGVHGIGVEYLGRRGWTRPSEVLEKHLTPDIALAGPENTIGLKHIHKVRTPQEVKYFRFWTYHLWQADGGGLPIVLDRGAKMILPQDVTGERVEASLETLGAYLAGRQNDAGGFVHEYMPGAARFRDMNSARAQLRALSGLAAYAAWSKRPELHKKVQAGADSFSSYLEPLELKITSETGEQSREAAGMVLAPPGHADTLEITARLLISLLWCPGGAGDADTCGGLVKGLLASQQDSGLLRLDVAEKQLAETTLEPAPEIDQAGWALFALAQAYGVKKDVAIERAALRALSHYDRELRKNPTPVAAAALARAFARQYQNVSDARLSDFVFEVADQVVAVQLNEGNCLYPEMYGAINARKPGLVGADSAQYTSLLCDAAELAGRIGDKTREQRYTEAARSAVRFLLQLQITPPGDYYMQRPSDALGGIRNSPWDHRVRADHCADALEAMIRARQTVFSADR